MSIEALCDRLASKYHTDITQLLGIVISKTSSITLPIPYTDRKLHIEAPCLADWSNFVIVDPALNRAIAASLRTNW